MIQLRILIWKSMVLRIRNMPLTLLEFVLPLVFTVLIVLLKGLQSAPPLKDIDLWKSTYNDSFPFEIPSIARNSSLLLHFENFVPKEEFKENLNRIEPCKNLKAIEERNYEKRLNDFMRSDKISEIGTLVGRAVVKSSALNQSNYTEKVDIQMRLVQLFLTSNLYALKASPYNDTDYGFGYYRSQFLSLQYCLYEAYIHTLPKGKNATRNVKIAKIPYPKGSKKFDWITLIPFAIAVGWAISCILLVKRVCEEKESDLKHVFHMMGTSSFIYWSHHFLSAMLLMSVQSCLVAGALMLKISDEPVIKRATYSLIFIILLLYNASSILSCLALATFHSRSNRAVVYTFIWWSLSIIFPKVAFDYHRYTPGYIAFPYAHKIILFVPNAALEYAFSIIRQIETKRRNEPLGFSQIYLPSPESTFTLADILTAMLISLLLYTFVILIVDCNWKDPFGIKRLCARFMTFDGSHRVRRIKEPGISIENLTKKLDAEENSRYLLKNLTFEVKRGELTVVLGANDSGKSSLVRILSGEIEPTSGDAFINGSNVYFERNKALNEIGICLEQNIFYDDLTVLENLKLFAGVKGVHPLQISSQALLLMYLLQLNDRKRVEAKNLSLRSQRKLAVGIALIGENKTLILDEPTQKMDNKSARSIQETLLKLSSDHTIMVTTKNIEEAVRIGSKIVVLVDGNLKMQATDKELRKQYAIGYQIKFEKTENWKSTSFERLAQAYFDKNMIKLVSQKHQEFTVQMESQNINLVNKFLGELNSRVTEIGAKVVDISVATMELLLLKLSYNVQSKMFDVDTSAKSQSKRIILKAPSLWTTFLLILKMRFCFTIRNCKNFTMQFIIMAILLSVLLFEEWLVARRSTIPKIKFNITELYGYNYPFLESGDETNVLTKYRKVLEKYKLNDSLRYSTNSIEEYLTKNENAPDFDSYKYHFLVGATFSDKTDCSGDIVAYYNREALHSLPASLNLVYETIQSCILDTSNASISIEHDPVDNTPLINLFMSIPLRILYFSQFSAILACLVLFPLYFHSYIRRSKILTEAHSDSTLETPYNIMIFICESSPVFAVLWAIQKLNSFTHKINMCNSMSEAWKTAICSNPLIIHDEKFHVFSWREVYTCCQESCNSEQKCFIENRFSPFTFGPHGILQEIAMLIVDSIILWGLFLMVESEIEPTINETDIQRNTNSEVKVAAFHSIIKKAFTYPIINEDVERENKEVVASLAKQKISDKIIIVRKLVKRFEGYPIVDDISFEVDRGHIFGIIGVTGSGCNTLLKIIAGETTPTSGLIIVNGYKYSDKKYKFQIGYSPLKAILFSKLTVKETLNFYAILRGVNSNDLETELKEITAILKLEDRDKLAEKLSAIEQTKLSIAVGFIGSPALILLDSPIRETNENLRKELITSIIDLKKRHNSSLIITSTYFEECESFCNRIAVMSVGQLKCIGVPLLLRDKYNSGFFVVIKMQRPIAEQEASSNYNKNEASIATFMNKAFPKACFLVNRYLYMLHFHIIGDNSITNDTIYSKMVNITEDSSECKVDEYLVLRASVEQFATISIWMQSMMNKC
ncbi:ATP-binding cassette sub-family A member 1-like protein [Dinothrombium tinctorium]|uniref:ATP-binding cassette sub-family A member 1-like protein n=1 Tax=Dinothrombium tinctorium TaxID=1965070 RepID=A0A3S3PBP4_9ACAR|nr:ATP-binding cassette sub-family A member 1-like protein [Dinothrombium tinctorium]RWS12062.1 ATP-binding cassette sub-family A member 1-like protein [Dinothrombium tinctorium]RWS13384.1 ATP-binding cassette sub-family A member 1-like protein [Dinothrombium tinctorium]RWS13481.1 ATP-binding cassette sub-family A member 1-like protein [Dinothrombium tinctorium]